MPRQRFSPESPSSELNLDRLARCLKCLYRLQPEEAFMKMRFSLPFRISLALILCLAASRKAHGWDTSGHVFCDVNQNEAIDAGDAPLPGILVVVTNQSGTFSNAVFTTTPDGAFVLTLPNQADTYIEYLHPATLSPSTVQVLP